MDLHVQQKIEQKLSPQMMQSLHILQMNLMELQEYVEQETMENPMIELSSAAPSTPAAAAPGERGYGAWDAELSAAAAQENLYDYLRAQLDTHTLTPEVRGAVETVLTGLDRDGYLEESREELSARGGQSAAAIAAAEELVRGLEPAGVGARSLSECLELQLLRRGGDELALAIARSYLPDVAQHHYHHIAEQTGESVRHVQAACRRLRALSPRPGAFLNAGDEPVYILPDVSVARDGAQLRVTMLRHTPEPRVSAEYKKLMEDDPDPEVRRYLREKYRRTTLLIQNVEQRRHTIALCVERIVEHQRDFFDGGTLRPLTMAQVAREAGIHESTVSRAIRGKYLQCERGIYPLSAFFARALPASDDSTDTPPTADAARRAILACVRDEDSKKPLSDRRIAEALAAEGISVSRRTVAKYREELHIPPAHGRRG